MIPERPEPEPGAWVIGAYYRNFVRIRIAVLWDARCKPFRVESGTIWICNRVFRKLEKPRQEAPYWLDYVELIAVDPRPGADPSKVIHFNCMIGNWINHTRGFKQIESPLDLLALSCDKQLPVTGDYH